MNWRLIFLLSLFGLFMGIATVYFIPSSVEPFCWLIIFLLCAYLIAKNAPGKYFLHGFCLGLANCVWIIAAHILLFDSYASSHTAEIAMMHNMPYMPKVMMLITGPFVGIASGLIIGLFSFIAGKLVKKRVA